MIREFYRNELWFYDVKGARREIGGLPLPNRLRFLEYRDRAWKSIQAHPDQLASDLYDSDRDFRTNCNCMLLLCGIDPDWCDWQLVLGLLFRHEGNDGLIIQQEFPAAESDSKDSASEDVGNVYQRAIASLMTIDGTDYLKAKAIVDSVPWDELQGVLEQLTEMRSGKPKKAEPKDEDVLAAWGMQRPDPEKPATSFEELGFTEVNL